MVESTCSLCMENGRGGYMDLHNTTMAQRPIKWEKRSQIGSNICKKKKKIRIELRRNTHRKKESRIQFEKSRDRERRDNERVRLGNQITLTIVIITIMISCCKWGLTFHSFHSLKQATNNAIWCRSFLSLSFSLFLTPAIFVFVVFAVGGIWNSLPICHYTDFVLTITQLNQLLFFFGFYLMKAPDERVLNAVSFTFKPLN